MVELPIEYRKIIAADALKYYESLIQTNNADPAVRYETGFALGNVGLMHWTLRRARPGREALPALDRCSRRAGARRSQAGGISPAMRLSTPSARPTPGVCPSGERVGERVPNCDRPLRGAAVRNARKTEYLDGAGRTATAISSRRSRRPPRRRRSIERWSFVRRQPASHFSHRARWRRARRTRRTARRARWSRSRRVWSIVPASVGRDHQLVIRIGRAMIELEPGSGDGWVALAAGHYLAGDWNAAEAEFGKADELVDTTYAATPTAAELKPCLGNYTALSSR